ncbi:MAG: AIR synthase related protein, partial [Candidatus Moraniibacteriota bacterium]
MAQSNEYGDAGVDYSKIEPFKQAMKAVGQRTLDFPLRRHVRVRSEDHGATFAYLSPERSHIWCSVQEGLGNKNWIAEWMYQMTGKPHYFGIGIDAVLMAVNDLIAQGAMPVLYMDEVAAGDSEWFQDSVRANDLADGFYSICKQDGIALPAGESPSLRYLIKAEPPVKSAPSLSGSAIGIIAPSHRILRSVPQIGDVIIGAPSSGVHSNGISLVIKRAMSLPDAFLTKLPSGKTLGEEALIPTLSYVALMEALLENEIAIHAVLPGTGDGVGKIAFDKRPFTYRIHSWVK